MEHASSKTYTESWDAGLNQIPYEELWGQAGAFTTMRLDVGKSWCCAYLLEKHIARLFNTFAELGWSPLFEARWVEQQVREFANKVQGEGRYSLRVMMSDVMLSLCATPKNEPTHMQEGILWEYTRDKPAYKTLDYTDILDELQTIDREREELILVSEDERLVEGATTCLIFIGGSRIVAPRRDRLRSITLELIMEKWRGVSISTEDVYLKDIKEFDEIILCGSGKGIVNLNGIEELDWQCRATAAYRALRLMHDNALIDYKYTWI